MCNKRLESNTRAKQMYLCNHMQSLVASGAHINATRVQKQVPEAVDARGCGNGLQLLKAVLVAYQCTTCTRNSPLHYVVRFTFCPIHTPKEETSASADAAACKFDCELLASNWSSRKRLLPEASPKLLLNVIYSDFANGANSHSNSNIK